MVLSFHSGRLARIEVTYDRDRTAGLTDADLHDALSGMYGTSFLLSRSTTPTTVASFIDSRPIGQWGDADTLVLLWREAYPQRVKLTITSLVDDAALQAAIADGEGLDASEAPARDLARRAADTAALRTRDENARRDNKATFKP